MGRKLPRGLAACLVCAAGCGGGLAEGPPPVAPAPSSPILEDASQPPATIGWSFEHGLEGWSLVAGGRQPACGDVSADRLRGTAGRAFVELDPPGDYWRTPVDIGSAGACRLDTGAARRKTRLHSPDFTISAPFFAFRAGGGGGKQTRVELGLAEAGYDPVRVEHGPGSLALRGVVWDVSPFVGKVARLTVIDDAVDGEPLLVDDFRDARERPAERPAPVWGFADLHTHPLSQLAFGRHVFFGRNDGPIEQALGSCELEHGRDGLGGRAGPLMALLEASPSRLAGHRNSGSPSFSGWPLWSSMAHQQMYVDWIRRAQRGGLRLLVAFTVNNEQLAESFQGSGDTSDMATTRVQLAELAAFVGRHPDFMALASSSREARAIIRSGRLAVVPGVEVDAIGGCRRDTDCSVDDVREAVRELHRLGARHVFPVHLADNALAGAAVFRDGIPNLLTWYLRGTYQTVEHDPTLVYTLNQDDQELAVRFAGLAHLPNRYGASPYRPPFAEYAAVRAGHRNRRGLTPLLGAAAIDELIRLGMLIDVDHMSQNARRDTFAIAERRGAPVVMSHAWLRDLGYLAHESSDSEKWRSEMMKAPEELERVRRLGGMVAPITNQGDVRRAQGSGVAGECPGSSSAWLQAYAYTVQRMGPAGVGIGSDFNGLVQEPLPRFGPFACIGRAGHAWSEDARRTLEQKDLGETIRQDADSQRHGVTYATPLRDAREFRFRGPLANSPYGHDERVLFVALAAFEAQADPSKLELDAADRELVTEVLAGLAARTPPRGDDWRKAAYLVKTGASLPPWPRGLRQRFSTFRRVFRSFRELSAGNRGAPLERSHAGLRDFDINLDGLAHYGMLPDFLQDVSNQLRHGGGTVKDLRALFRSAEGYLRMWERAEAAAAPNAAASDGRVDGAAP